MSVADWSDKLIEGGKIGAFGLACLMIYRFVVFACEFLAGRYDARQLRLEQREERVDKSISERLRHLELQEIANRKRILFLEKHLRIVAAELWRLDNGNPKLEGVAEALGLAFGIEPDTPDDMEAELRKMP